MTRKPFMLALAASVGGLAALIWPAVAPRLRLQTNQGEGPAFVSVAEAQRQISYPLWVPREIPGGGTFVGAVVARVKAPDRQPSVARAETTRWAETGYGLEIIPLNGGVGVYGVPGSPAERAGLVRAAPLLAINGRFLAGKQLDVATSAVYHARPPLSVTYGTPGGGAHTVLLRPTHFITHPRAPHVYRGKMAGLDFHVRGRSLSVQEWPVGEGPPPHGDHMHQVRIGAGTVLLADSDQGPIAFWKRGSTRFVMENEGGVLSQQEQIRFIDSMYLPNYQAKR